MSRGLVTLAIISQNSRYRSLTEREPFHLFFGNYRLARISRS